MRASSEAIHWRMKFEPMKPAPPVTRMRSSMLEMPTSCKETPRSDSNHNHSRTRSRAQLRWRVSRPRGYGPPGSGDRGPTPAALPDCRSLDLELLTRSVFVWRPAQYVVIGFFDRTGDLGPEILVLDPLPFPGSGLTPQFGIVDEQLEHALKICRSPRWNVKPAPSITSLFSGISLVN